MSMVALAVGVMVALRHERTVDGSVKDVAIFCPVLTKTYSPAKPARAVFFQGQRGKDNCVHVKESERRKKQRVLERERRIFLTYIA